jgi:hypothetical protein
MKTAAIALAIGIMAAAAAPAFADPDTELNIQLELQRTNQLLQENLRNQPPACAQSDSCNPIVAYPMTPAQMAARDAEMARLDFEMCRTAPYGETFYRMHCR